MGLYTEGTCTTHTRKSPVEAIRSAYMLYGVHRTVRPRLAGFRPLHEPFGAVFY
jgi:hypothetical protein